MKDKPRMYQNKVNKEFHNNKLIYTSFDKTEKYNNFDDIIQKINNIINAPNFIYSKLVHIVIGNDTIIRKIVGIYNNNLVTIDNEWIPVSSIKDIYI